MALWCRDMPTVTAPMGDTPKAITLVVPYYENASFFAEQVRGWLQYPADLLRFLRVIVVDDGSPQPAKPRPDVPFLRLFRIQQDVRWNWLAARNIGAHHAEPGWLLMTDMDHVLPVDTLRGLVFGQHDPSVIYAFSRREHTGEPIGPHSASFFLTRDLFWRIGGYDETLSGHYGTDGDWRRRMAKHAPIQVLTDELTRFEYVDDSSTQRYLRKQPEDAAVKRLVAARKPGWRPKTLSFAYAEVTC